MAIIFAGKYNNVGTVYTNTEYFAGVSIFASGFLVGFCNLFCGYVDRRRWLPHTAKD